MANTQMSERRPSTPLHQVVDRELTWVQSGAFSRRHELRAGDETIAALWHPKPIGSLALGEAAEGRWTFKRSGFLRPRVSVRVEGTEQDLLVVEMIWSGGGRFRLASGERFRWGCSSFWRMEWEIGREDGPALLTIANQLAPKMKARLIIDPAARRMPELPVLVLLGWYLMVLAFEDSAAAGA